MTIQARLASSVAIQTGGSIPSDIQWMPPGKHTITALRNGKPAQLTVNVDSSVAARMNSALQSLRAKAASGSEDLPYFDLNHNDDGASAYVTEFFWGGDDRQSGGVRAKVEWTELGKQAIAGKSYRRFSPTFTLNQAGEIQCAGVNMGGLVTRAAFKEIQPLFARDAGSDLPSWVPAWWSVYLEEKQKLDAAHETQTQPLRDKIASLEHQIATAPDSERPKTSAQLAPQIQELQAQLFDIEDVDYADAWDAAVRRDPAGYRDFLERTEGSDPKSKADLMQAVAGKIDEAFVIRCKKSPSLYAFYCVSHGYSNPKDFEVPKAPNSDAPFVRGATFLAKRDGIAFDEACLVLAKYAPELYESYREKIGTAAHELVLETLTAQVMAKAASVPFQPSTIAERGPQKKSEQSANNEYEAWRRENLLKR